MNRAWRRDSFFPLQRGTEQPLKRNQFHLDRGIMN